MKTFQFFIILCGLSMCAMQSNNDGLLLQRPYSFIILDGEISRLELRGDTLLYLHGRIHDQRQVGHLSQLTRDSSKRSRIHTIRRDNDVIYLALERLDNIPLSNSPVRENRYHVLAIRQPTDHTIEMVDLTMGMTKIELDSLWALDLRAKDLFFITYFSDDHWKNLSLLKPIDTEEDAREIVAELKSEKVKEWADAYMSNPVKDMYGTVFTAEIMNRVCISLGYNPIGASRAVQELTSR
ncbi:hypothetical protein FAZ19_18970 [Sphingobacterium alkalisoli]|uniref:Uncharacterized protein n=1 Tax=Sphingobacterium alkalisoli TaxID=1874115 RepID=A0A4U0GUB6_9SPHI|nr:hypothetical protein [Sphingobacterium alkalisoli]TJY62557.1 hypothetical protein FAZ19_18970 [Sphingobacterium alkalisoli]GGH27417.1 hypothetical protein GCM10011418_37350 [Sphingobacterium alkalisoli]